VLIVAVEQVTGVGAYAREISRYVCPNWRWACTALEMTDSYLAFPFYLGRLTMEVFLWGWVTANWGVISNAAASISAVDYRYSPVAVVDPADIQSVLNG